VVRQHTDPARVASRKVETARTNELEVSVATGRLAWASLYANITANKAFVTVFVLASRFGQNHSKPVND